MINCAELSFFHRAVNHYDKTGKLLGMQGTPEGKLLTSVNDVASKVDPKISKIDARLPQAIESLEQDVKGLAPKLMLPKIKQGFFKRAIKALVTVAASLAVGAGVGFAAGGVPGAAIGGLIGTTVGLFAANKLNKAKPPTLDGLDDLSKLGKQINPLKMKVS